MQENTGCSVYKNGSYVNYISDSAVVSAIFFLSDIISLHWKQLKLRDIVLKKMHLCKYVDPSFPMEYANLNRTFQWIAKSALTAYSIYQWKTLLVTLCQKCIVITNVTDALRQQLSSVHGCRSLCPPSPNYRRRVRPPPPSLRAPPLIATEKKPLPASAAAAVVVATATNTTATALHPPSLMSATKPFLLTTTPSLMPTTPLGTSYLKTRPSLTSTTTSWTAVASRTPSLMTTTPSTTSSSTSTTRTSFLTQMRPKKPYLTSTGWLLMSTTPPLKALLTPNLSCRVMSIRSYLMAVTPTRHKTSTTGCAAVTNGADRSRTILVCKKCAVLRTLHVLLHQIHRTFSRYFLYLNHNDCFWVRYPAKNIITT